MTSEAVAEKIISEAAGEAAFSDSQMVNRLYYGISEVAKLCQIENHVIRYWEKQFPSLNPVKRKGRRYFTKSDLLLVKQIKDLLYAQGFTIEGAKEKLADQKSGKSPRPEKIKSVVLDATEQLKQVLQLLKEV